MRVLLIILQRNAFLIVFDAFYINLVYTYQNQFFNLHAYSNNCTPRRFHASPAFQLSGHPQVTLLFDHPLHLLGNSRTPYTQSYIMARITCYFLNREYSRRVGLDQGTKHYRRISPIVPRTSPPPLTPLSYVRLRLFPW